MTAFEAFYAFTLAAMPVLFFLGYKVGGIRYREQALAALANTNTDYCDTCNAPTKARTYLTETTA